LQLAKTGPSVVVPGQNVSYTLTVTNAGPSDSGDVTLADVTPAGMVFVSNSGDCASAFPCSLGTLAAGATRTVLATFHLPSDYAGAGPISNTAEVTSATSDPVAANNSASATSAIGAAAADLSVTKTGPATLTPGEQITYTIIVTNAGPSDAVGVSLADPTPAGLTFESTSGDCTTSFPCSLGTVAAGQSRSITAVYSVPLDASVYPIENTATVSSPTADPFVTNNQSTASTGFPQGAGFYTVAPCRAIDTRATGGPLAGGAEREVALAGTCEIPSTARAVSYNLTVTGATANGNLRLYPLGATAPLVSSINFVLGVTRANNGVIQLGADGKVVVLSALAAAGSADFIIDVNGYFE
jgi:uncharacterized repeat protein (TIGR01451 family)